jgi:hypothetical protein
VNGLKLPDHTVIPRAAKVKANSKLVQVSATITMMKRYEDDRVSLSQHVLKYLSN